MLLFTQIVTVTYDLLVICFVTMYVTVLCGRSYCCKLHNSVSVLTVMYSHSPDWLISVVLIIAVGGIYLYSPLDCSVRRLIVCEPSDRLQCVWLSSCLLWSYVVPYVSWSTRLILIALRLGIIVSYSVWLSTSSIACDWLPAACNYIDLSQKYLDFSVTILSNKVMIKNI